MFFVTLIFWITQWTGGKTWRLRSDLESWCFSKIECLKHNLGTSQGGNSLTVARDQVDPLRLSWQRLLLFADLWGFFAHKRGQASWDNLTLCFRTPCIYAAGSLAKSLQRKMLEVASSLLSRNLQQPFHTAGIPLRLTPLTSENWLAFCHQVQGHLIKLLDFSSLCLHLALPIKFWKDRKRVIEAGTLPCPLVSPTRLWHSLGLRQVLAPLLAPLVYGPWKLEQNWAAKILNGQKTFGTCIHRWNNTIKLLLQGHSHNAAPTLPTYNTLSTLLPIKTINPLDLSKYITSQRSDPWLAN